jgi:hypothetical protein
MKYSKTTSLILLVFVITFIRYGIAVIRRGFSARGTPSTIEKLAATTARELAIPSNYRQLHNPFPASISLDRLLYSNGNLRNYFQLLLIVKHNRFTGTIFRL